jgi:hypothetical protein
MQRVIASGKIRSCKNLRLGSLRENSLCAKMREKNRAAGLIGKNPKPFIHKFARL